MAQTETMNPTHLAESSHTELKLHDDTIQLLFGIGLKIEYCLEVADESPAQAKDGLDGVITDLGQLIDDIRGRMQDLKISGVGTQQSEEALH